MKFSNAIILAAATGSYASIQDVKAVLESVEGAITSLNTAAKSFDGNVDAVKSKSEALVSTLKAGKSKIDGSSDLTLTDALGLTTPVQALTKKGQSLADDFKARRSDVEKAGACGTVRSQLTEINTNSEALIKSVVGKVPKDAQSVAQTLASGLTKVLKQAEGDFSEENCKDSGKSSATETGGASQTSAAAHSHEMTAPGTTLVPTASAAPIGGNGTTGTLPPVTAGASFLAPAGALVMAVAAALL
ncbi:cell wall protein [Metarhizium rileyi]|uniref:Cell wall protein n=1 Tax=Metarhizium rileyi (strain RCEF 4871) TaxID=1649241 RepID=A0A166S7D4_METRR|nr:cell wall protein [Metarhizium rileyi RCEF 4871]TWU71924.1 hypothetical protein ED733_003092 [Metarhizium rileyi]